MITRITRVLLLLQLLAALAIAAPAMYLTRYPGIALCIGISAVLLIRMLITANNFLIAQRYRSPLPPQCSLSWIQAWGMYFEEFKSTMLSSSWTMPFCAFAKHIADFPAGLPVLLVHGYGCNSGYWHAMSKALAQARITHYAIDMEPITASIDDYVSVLQQAIERMCAETGSPKIIVVAHSMGGLAARAYLRAYGINRIAKLVTLGTPHHGTVLARFGLGKNCREMHWNPRCTANRGHASVLSPGAANEQEAPCSEWLRRLRAAEDKQVYGLIVSIYSHHDNIVAPQNSSYLPGARNIDLCGIGHVALALQPQVQAQVINEILHTQ